MYYTGRLFYRIPGYGSFIASSAISCDYCRAQGHDKRGNISSVSAVFCSQLVLMSFVRLALTRYQFPQAALDDFS